MSKRKIVLKTSQQTVEQQEEEEKEQPDVVQPPPRKLKIDNTTLTRQIRQILAAGTNISFDTSDNALTVINGAASLPIDITTPVALLDVLVGDGEVFVNQPIDNVLVSNSLVISRIASTLGIELPDYVVDFYQPNVTYSDESNSFIYDGLVFAYDSVRQEFVESRRLLNDNFLFKYSSAINTSAVNNELVVSSSSCVDYVPWMLNSVSAAAPTNVLNTTINDDDVYATNFVSNQNLSMSSSQYGALLNYANDYTLVVAGTFPLDQTATNFFFNTTGNVSIYPMSFGNNTTQLNTLVYNLGEPHYIPYVQATGIYVFRVSFTTAFVSMLDVFFNGRKIYSRAISTTLTDFALGLGGLVNLGNSANSSSFSMQLLGMTAYTQALPDQQCIDLSKIYNFTKQVLPAGTTIPFPSSIDNIAGGAPSNHAVSFGASVSSFGSAPFVLVQATSGNQPVYQTVFNAIAMPTYNLKFSGSTSWMGTSVTIPAINSNIYGTFAIGYVPNVPANVYNEVLNINFASPADLVTLKTSYTASVHTFVLFLNGTQKCSLTIPHVAGTNDEFVLFFVKSTTQLALVITRVDSQKIVGSCSFTYASNAISGVSIGRKNAPASIFTYFLGDMWYYPRNLASFEYKQHTLEYKQTYNLPLVGTIFSG